LVPLLALSAFGAPPGEGPADESAYWVLKFHGVLTPVPLLSQNTLDFGELEVGEVKRASVRILNKGYGDLVIRKVTLSKGVEFGIKKTSCTKPLEFGESCEITVEFKPDSPGDYTDTLLIETNAPQAPLMEVTLRGKAVGAVLEIPQEMKGEQPANQTTAGNATVAPLKEPQNKKPEEVKEKKGEKPKEEKTTAAPRIWVVKPCDTLWDISKQVYGTPLLWAAIYEANKDRLLDPWLLKVGMKLEIPKLTPAEREKYKKETLKLMEEMANRPLGPKCP